MRAKAQAAQKQFEQAQTEALERATKGDTELPTAAGIETKLSESLSPDRFDKAQQLIDQYGTEEGLRRLRQSDPEAARRFEREGRGAPSRDTPVRSETRDGGQPPNDSP